MTKTKFITLSDDADSYGEVPARFSISGKKAL